MTKKTDNVSEEGAVELTEDALDQASGGAGYLKIKAGNPYIDKTGTSYIDKTGTSYIDKTSI